MPSQRISPPEKHAEPARDSDSLPDSSDPSGPCPRCGRVSNFTEVGSGPVTYTPDGGYSIDPNGEQHRLYDEQVTILECNGCRNCVVVIEEQLIGGVRGGKSGQVSYRGFHWWPPPSRGTLGRDVPDRIAEAYAEGVRCLSANSPNAGVAMFRTALSHLVNDRGSDEAKAKSDLKDKLKKMVEDGGFPSSLGDWATHIRLYGNAGSHPDLFGDVTTEEARDVSKLVQTLIEVVYVLPGNIARRQAERTDDF